MVSAQYARQVEARQPVAKIYFGTQQCSGNTLRSIRFQCAYQTHTCCASKTRVGKCCQIKLMCQHEQAWTHWPATRYWLLGGACWKRRAERCFSANWNFASASASFCRLFQSQVRLAESLRRPGYVLTYPTQSESKSESEAIEFRDFPENSFQTSLAPYCR